MTKAERIRRTAKRTKPSDLERLVEWAKKRKAELDAEWKASEGQSASDVIRGQWLAYDEMLEKHLQPKLDRLRRAAK